MDTALLLHKFKTQEEGEGSFLVFFPDHLLRHST